MKTNNILKTLALPVAVAMTLLTASCSSEDNAIEQPSTARHEIPVTVSVTRSSEATTRAIYDSSTKTVKFSEGDKLFVKGQEATASIFSGILSYSADTPGKFSGTITTTNAYTGTADDLFTSANESSIEATLLPSDYETYDYLSVAGSDANRWLVTNYTEALVSAATSEETKKLAIEQLGYEQAIYYSDGKFTLMHKNAILNYSISGLDANTTYTPTISNDERSVTGSFTSDASGNAYFAVPFWPPIQAKTYTLSIDGFKDIAVADKDIFAGHVYNVSRTATAKPMISTPLTLIITKAGNLQFDSYNDKVGNLKYTVNGTEYSATSGGIIENLGVGNVLTFYCNGAQASMGEIFNESTSKTTIKAQVYGNPMSLLDGTDFATNTSVGESAFSRLFYGDDFLSNHPEKPIVLPATTLAESCYSDMFSSCTSLTTAPELPATTLAPSCYSFMFNGCKELTTAPVLPAMIMETRCYNSMFYNCIALTTAPALPATTLAESCYSDMFHGCTGLTAAPALPATTLADYCYYQMFSGCSKIETAPVLPATTLAEGCYNHMFSGSGLTAAPVLPATTLVDGCYNGMFTSCTDLTATPKLHAMTLADYCYYYMFWGCTSLENAYVKPSYTNNSGKNEMYEMFNGVSSNCVLHTTSDAASSWKGKFNFSDASNNIKTDWAD